MTRSRPSRLRTWLQLVRAPNLFTVPGDPLVGYLLASYGAIEWALLQPILASLCFYAAGLLLNDLADLAEDRAERPSRPLPSGAAQPGTVRLVMGLLFGLGLALCAPLGAWALGVGGALALSVVTYNLFTKALPVVGALNMGLCRGLSLLLGATAVPHGDLSLPLLFHGRLNHLAVAFLTVTLYIAAVTQLARFETKSAVPGFAKWLPAAALLGGMINFVPMVNSFIRPPMIALFLLALVSSLQCAGELLLKPESALPPIIGRFIRMLLPLQAAFAAGCGAPWGFMVAASLLLLWPISRAVGQRFYAS